MNEEKQKDTKRCLFCHKKLINEKDLVCRRCWLSGVDVGEKIAGGLAIASTVAVTIAAGISGAKNPGKMNIK
jgi:hypothetical protein